MNELLKTLNEYLQAAAKVIVQQAPEVWQHTLLLVRIEAAYTLAIILIVYGILIWSFKFSRRHIIQRTRERYCKSDRCRDIVSVKYWDLDHFFGFQFCATIGILIGWSMFTILTMLHILLGLFAPELWILYQLADKVGII